VKTSLSADGKANVQQSFYAKEGGPRAALPRH